MAALRLSDKIAEADGAEEFEPLDDFAADALGDQSFAGSEAEIDGGGERAIEGQGSEVRDGEAADFDGQGLGAQALAAADGAGRGGHEVHHVLAIAFAARLVDGVAQVSRGCRESRCVALRPLADRKPGCAAAWGQVFEGLA